jgi:CheY-like chemotaxis protein/HPt (histidine-containing phosphotransfer) domain-containing protein
MRPPQHLPKTSSPGAGLSQLKAGEEVSRISQTRFPLRILVADDTLAVRDVVSSILGHRGHQGDFVSNGRDAVERCRMQLYDGILMDVQMPEMNGLEATERIRALPMGNRFAIVGVTAYALRDIRRRCLEAGMNAVMRKPIVIKNLLQTLEDSVFQCRQQKAGLPQGSEIEEMERPTDSGLPEMHGSQVLNLMAARRRLGNDESLLQDLARFFLEDAPALVDKLHLSLAENDLDEAARSAHSLKGIALNFDALAAVQVAQAIEDAANQGNPGQIKSLVPELERETNRALKALKREVLGE